VTATSGERLARLLALVPWLVRNDGVTIADCAAHFNVTEEELERDLWLLVVCGTPGYGPDQLVDIDFWDEGVIHVLDPQTLERPLRLTHEESMTLLLALRMLAQLPGISDRDAIVTAAAKIEQNASEVASARFVAVQVEVLPEVRAAVDAALIGHRELALRYAAATRDEVTERIVEPIRVLAVDGIGYLEAFCQSAGALRTFRLDRILSADVGAPIGETVERPSPAAPEQEPVTATLRLAPSARWVIDVHSGTEVAHEGPDTLVRLPLLSLDWGVRLVLSLGGAATVREPVELRAAVADAAEAALAGYPREVP
jgi:proteasome accessory factor C